MNPLGLYIHIPYCLHKCGYCDFNSHPINEKEVGSYVNALLLEMDHYAKTVGQDYLVTSIFFGGGTPSTLPSSSLNSILNRCIENFPVDSKAEITIEVNPATGETCYFPELREKGFNRVSIGVQSFNAEELQRLDRIHSPDEVYSTVDNVKKAGFDNFSLDLMFALPGQTSNTWKDNLSQALSLNPDHLSAYNLTIEPETAFYKLQSMGKLELPPDDFQLELFQYTITELKSAGFEHYEISNFAKPGKACRHNLNYWNNGEYLGLGAGSSSYKQLVRYKNLKLPSKYIRCLEEGQLPVESREQLQGREAMGEAMMVGLRLMRGVKIDAFESRFQTSFYDTYRSELDTLLQKDLITLEKNTCALTSKGLYLADSVILEFMN